jgi:hypothetical protein
MARNCGQFLVLKVRFVKQRERYEELIPNYTTHYVASITLKSLEDFLSLCWHFHFILFIIAVQGIYCDIYKGSYNIS